MKMNADQADTKENLRPSVHSECMTYRITSGFVKRMLIYLTLYYFSLYHIYNLFENGN